MKTLEYGSHVFSWGHTIGKVYGVAYQANLIVHPHSEKVSLRYQENLTRSSAELESEGSLNSHGSSIRLSCILLLVLHLLRRYLRLQRG